jgi:hypothetical protein
VEPLYLPEDAAPPAEIRFQDVHVEPWPDGRRVRVHITITPFQKPPSIRASIMKVDEELARTHIIETIQHHIVFTMHIRGDVADQQPLNLNAVLYYNELGDVDQQIVSFTLPPQPAQEN